MVGPNSRPRSGLRRHLRIRTRPWSTVSESHFFSLSGPLCLSQRRCPPIRLSLPCCLSCRPFSPWRPHWNFSLCRHPDAFRRPVLLPVRERPNHCFPFGTRRRCPHGSRSGIVPHSSPSLDVVMAPSGSARSASGPPGPYCQPDRAFSFFPLSSLISTFVAPVPEDHPQYNRLTWSSADDPSLYGAAFLRERACCSSLCSVADFSVYF